ARTPKGISQARPCKAGQSDLTIAGWRHSLKFLTRGGGDGVGNGNGNRDGHGDGGVDGVGDGDGGVVGVDDGGGGVGEADRIESAVGGLSSDWGFPHVFTF
ncbi:unnamed protein product, partial [Scytosiphon promiscuus]